MRWLARIGSILFTLILLVSALSVVPTKVAQASLAPIVVLPNPPWWTDNTGAFSQCDSYNYNHGHTHLGITYPGTGTNAKPLSPGAFFQGVPACGRDPNTSNPYVYVYFTPDSSATQEIEWQCTELVKRYLFLKYGVRSIAGNGNQVVDNYSTTYPNLFTRIANDGSHIIQAGDVLSYYSPDNHTAIVSDTSGLDANGTGTITILEQNLSSTGINVQSVQNWVIKNGAGNSSANADTVSAWLHGPSVGSWGNSSPTGTTADTIYSMAATSASNVYAAGMESVPNVGKRPVIYNYNGTSWQKFTPDPVSYYANHWLYGIAARGTEAWAVGEYTYGSTHPTLAYHWTGAFWVRVTSDSPAPINNLNTLKGVGIDGAGNVFAVGSYWPAYNKVLPLLEKWDGTKLAQQSLSLPSGETYGELNAVSFSSATNGWAVGNAGGAVQTYLVYHYDGTSWTSSLGSIYRGNLLSVAAVSDTEAWAVGTQGSSNTPLLLHYMASTGWTEYTGYPPGIKLNSVATDGTNVWIAGWDGGAATTLHYFGYGWARVNIPADFSSTVFQAVTVVSGEAWAGGQYGSAPSPMVYHY